MGASRLVCLAGWGPLSGSPPCAGLSQGGDSEEVNVFDLNLVFPLHKRKADAFNIDNAYYRNNIDI